MIVCRSCGHQNPDEAEFCASCRTYLAWDGDRVEAAAPPGPPPPAPAPAPDHKPGLVDQVLGAVRGSGTRTRTAPPVDTGPDGRTGPERDPAATATPAPVPDSGYGPVGDTRAVQPAPERPLPPAEPATPRVERRPGVRYCAVCGADNDLDRQLCRSCGASLLVAAPVKVSWWRRMFGRSRAGTVAGERPGRRRRKRSQTARRVFRGTVAAVLIAAVALLVGPFRSNASSAYRKVKGLVTTQYEPVKATSARASSAARGHAAGNVIDGVKDTAWAEGVPGLGVNQSVTVLFGRRVTIDRIGITPGASDNEKKFRAESRPRQIRVEFANGRQQVVTLTDTPTFQQFDIAATDVDRVRLVVIATFPGQSGQDTSIAEVEFFSKS